LVWDIDDDAYLIHGVLVQEVTLVERPSPNMVPSTSRRTKERICKLVRSLNVPILRKY
jgi:hypothetical protein